MSLPYHSRIKSIPCPGFLYNLVWQDNNGWPRSERWCYIGYSHKLIVPAVLKMQCDWEIWKLYMDKRDVLFCVSKGWFKFYGLGQSCGPSAEHRTFMWDYVTTLWRYGEWCVTSKCHQWCTRMKLGLELSARLLLHMPLHSQAYCLQLSPHNTVG